MSSIESVVSSTQIRIELANNEESIHLFGHNDEFLKMLENAFDAHVVARSNQINIEGTPKEVGKLKEAVEHLLLVIRKGHRLERQQVAYTIDRLKQGKQPSVGELVEEQIIITHRKKIIRPKSIAQREYIEAIGKNDIVFGIGPAGTGKTYLAMASAIKALTQDKVSRIILARPAVEAGESLGFLPGDMMEKVNPYLRPLYDALYDMLDMDRVRRFLERGIIEIAPLAFMRGRTLNNAFIVLDEAQNTTPEQMKMFLTRLGADSQAVITGDITQVDLPRGKQSGLIEASKIFEGVEGMDVTWFSKADVVRHPLVQKIIAAYENYQTENGEPS